MANTAGFDVRLDNFFNGITSGFARVQQGIANRQQEEAKQLAREQESLADAYSKVNTKGVQAVDIPEISKVTGGLYDLYYKASKSNSLEEKMQARLEIQRQLDGLSNFVELSKQRGKEEAELGKAYADPRNVGLFGTDFKSKYETLVNTPTSKLPQGAFSLNNFMSPDTSYIGKTIKQTVDEQFKNAPSVVRLGRNINVAGKSGVEQFQEQEISRDALGKALTLTYENDSKFKNTVDYVAQQKGLTPQQVIEEQLAGINTKHSKQIATSFAYKPTASGSDSETISTQRQRDNEGLMNLDPDVLQEVGATLLPKAKIEYLQAGNQDLIRFTIPKKEGERGSPSTHVVNVNDSNAFTKINTLMNQVTGEKVNSQKARTYKGATAGKPYVPKKTESVKQETSKKESKEKISW